MAQLENNRFSNSRCILISDEKVPMHKFDDWKTFESVVDAPNLGIMVDEPFVVFDFDNEIEFQTILRIVEAENINCRIMKSKRGGHFWFKSSTPLPNHVGAKTATTIPCDIRSWGKKSYVRIKNQGEYFEWLKWDEEVDDVPFWLTIVQSDYEFLNAKEGGRNDLLYKYIITLTKSGITREQVRDLYTIINEYLFADKMDARELSVIVRDEAFENIQPAFYDRRRFLHDTFSQYFKNDNYVYSRGGRLFMYDDGFYSDDVQTIERRMIQYVSEMSRMNRTEVLHYLHLITEEPKNTSIYHISCKNGLLDIRDGSLKPHSPEFFIQNKINASYNPDAYDEHVDKVIDKICCYDTELRKLVEEMIGYCIVPTSKFQKAFILYGGGSNGKSTLLDMIIHFLGENNVSSLSLKDLNHNFRVSEITSKLANIGDDISDEYMTDSSNFKKLVTGEDITVEAKHEKPFKIRNTAKLMFAANSLPMSFDKSNGMGRRLCLIPFNAQFSPNDDDYDPFIIDKLTTTNAMSYLMRIAVEGIQRVFHQNSFTEPEVVTQLLDEYKKENNNVLQFLDEFDICDRPNEEVYPEYSLWCVTNGMMAYKKRKFNSEIRSNTNYDLDVERRGGRTVQVWKIKM